MYSIHYSFHAIQRNIGTAQLGARHTLAIQCMFYFTKSLGLFGALGDLISEDFEVKESSPVTSLWAVPGVNGRKRCRCTSRMCLEPFLDRVS